ncbi:MAG: RyR domain-containing protein [Alphaproteobacteria bacterium]
MNPLTKLKNYWLLIALIFTALLLGLIGFKQVFPEFGFLTRCYMTVQLFLIDSQVYDLSETIGGVDGGGVPWTLEAARWLAAGLTFYGVFYAATRLLRRSGDRFRIRGLRGHTVVYGADEVTESYLREQKEAGRKCVLVSGSDALLKACRATGYPAVDLEGGLNHKLDSEDLRRAGLSQANAFYALDVEDPANLRALFLASELNASCEVVLRQDEPSGCDLMQRKEIFGLKDQRKLRVVSVQKQRARLLLKEFPLEVRADGGVSDAVHLVLLQLGAFEKAVAVQAALIGHYRNGGRVNLWLPSTELRDELLTDFPKLERCVNLKCMGEGSVRGVEEIGQQAGEGARITVLLTHLDPEQAYLNMLRLQERYPEGVGLRVMLKASGDKTLPKSIREHPNVAVLPDCQGLLGNTVLDEIDRLGRAVHETWYRGNVEQIEKAEQDGRSDDVGKLRQKPTFKKWADLNEAQRDDNRCAGDHIEVKIRAAGLDPKQPDLKAAWAELDTGVLEMLSRMEHERWAAPRWLANWEAGPRDDVRRIHNDLVPFDELDQGTKDYDTKQVKAAVQYLLGE